MKWLLTVGSSVGLTLLGWLAIEAVAKPMLEAQRAKKRAKAASNGKTILVLSSLLTKTDFNEDEVHTHPRMARAMIRQCRPGTFGACVISEADARVFTLKELPPDIKVFVYEEKS